MAEQGNQKKGNGQEQDLNQLLKVRREKLAELQANGKDPFQITKYDVTVHSTDVKEQYAEYGGEGGFHRRTYDVQACDGKSLLLQRPGPEGKHPVLRMPG